ncbi:hypothetical protein CR970_04630 [Candidatus Saccharibacteria bacterium]|nr:MAG: hypothetical protein CR970_04630 [Candidatus Saccharibacteria bacterium]
MPLKRKQPTTPPPDILPPVYTYRYARGTDLANDAANNTHQKHKPRAIKRIAIRLLIVVFVAVLGLGIWKGYDVIARLTGNRNPLQLFGAFREVDLQKTAGRTNILLAGYSVDDPNHAGAALTDSIMIISIDKANNQATIISIPRDLWVRIPGIGYSKINAAYPSGEDNAFNEAGYFNGGIGLLEKVLENNLDIDIHYYGLINYAAFRQAVDAVGGITVDLTSDDNPYGLHDPYTDLDLPNGVVTLDGQTALNLARSRGDGPGAYGFPRGDFNRTEHQRQLLIALTEKATSAGVLANPVKVVQLADAAGDNVRTSMSAAELQTVASIARNIPADSIQSYGLNDLDGTNYLRSYRSPNGQSALIPATGLDNYTSINAAIESLLYAPSEPDATD